jgi:hypothetical protein
MMELARSRVRRNGLCVLIALALSLEAVIYSDMNDLVCPFMCANKTRMNDRFNVLSVHRLLADSTRFYATSELFMDQLRPLLPTIQIMVVHQSPSPLCIVTTLSLVSMVTPFNRSIRR